MPCNNSTIYVSFRYILIRFVNIGRLLSHTKPDDLHIERIKENFLCIVICQKETVAFLLWLKAHSFINSELSQRISTSRWCYLVASWIRFHRCYVKQGRTLDGFLFFAIDGNKEICVPRHSDLFYSFWCLYQNFETNEAERTRVSWHSFGDVIRAGSRQLWGAMQNSIWGPYLRVIGFKFKGDTNELLYFGAQWYMVQKLGHLEK